MGTTFERLRKAEAVFSGLSKNFDRNKPKKKPDAHPPQISAKPAATERDPIAINNKLNDHLQKAGLAIEQIEQKGLKELKAALVRINTYIHTPETHLGLELNHLPRKSDIESKIKITLIERKKMLLERTSALINQQMIKQINGILDTLDDKTARDAIKKKLHQIAQKDQYLQNEYRMLNKFIDRG